MNCILPVPSSTWRLLSDAFLLLSAKVLFLSAFLSESEVRGAGVNEVWVHRYGNIVSSAQDQPSRITTDGRGDLFVVGSTDDGVHRRDLLILKYSGVDGSQLWVQRFNGPGNREDFASAVAVDAVGNAVVVGSSVGRNLLADIYTAKYAAADGALLWERRYHGPYHQGDGATAVAVDSDGNVIVTGYSYGNDGNEDYYTAKYAALDGMLIWERRYNGAANSYDMPQAVILDSMGNVVVTGYSSRTSGENSDYYTVKYGAKDGAVLWERSFNGPADQHDIAQAVAVDRSDNVLVTGYSASARGDFDYYTVKYAAADGAVLWEQRYDGAANADDQPAAIALDRDGNVVVTGYSVGISARFDFYTAKYRADDGRLVWERRYNSPDNFGDAATALGIGANGDVVVTGSSPDHNGTPTYYTAKYAASDGALLWDRYYDSPEKRGDAAQSLVLDVQGDVVVTGTSYNLRGDVDVETVRYRGSDGTPLWDERYDGPIHQNEFSAAVAIDPRGDVLVTGYSASNENFVAKNNDYYTARYSSADGALMWEHRYNGPANGDDMATAVAVDSQGDVMVTGTSVGETGTLDFYTAKYAAESGGLLWDRRYNGPGNRDDMALTLAVDGDGNVVVTGSSFNRDGDADYYTARYASNDGALLWEKRTDGGRAGDDYPISLALDTNANVVVTGTSWNAASEDYRAPQDFTVKYAGDDGTLRWEKHYRGPGRGMIEPLAVATDASGNVVVTGASYNEAGDTDFYTAKYAAADGALLWETRYGVSGDFDDSATAVAVDSRGDWLVTGFSRNASGNADYYTAKYSTTDGSLQWERRYDGPANGRDVPVAVAVDANDNVVVTGASRNAIGNDDFYTVKYSGVDGSTRWEQRYDGPANGNDQPQTLRCLALGPGGAVGVVGRSDSRPSPGVGFDYATIRYVDAPTLTPLPDGIGFQTLFPCTPGESYSVQRALEIEGDWTTLTTQVAPSGGYILYIDGTPTSGAGFYRLILAATRAKVPSEGEGF